MLRGCGSLSVFFFNDTATTEIYTLSLHDALPISNRYGVDVDPGAVAVTTGSSGGFLYAFLDRKSTRLNSSHQIISYAVFCLKKKNMTSSISSLTASWTSPSQTLSFNDSCLMLVLG